MNMLCLNNVLILLTQVEDVDMKFGQLDKLRENNWQDDKPVVKKKIVKVCTLSS